LSELDLEAFADELNLLRVRVMSGKCNGEERDRWVGMLEEWDELVPDEAERQRLWTAAVIRWADSDPPEIREAREVRESRANLRRLRADMDSAGKEIESALKSLGSIGGPSREELEKRKREKLEAHIAWKREARWEE